MLDSKLISKAEKIIGTDKLTRCTYIIGNFKVTITDYIGKTTLKTEYLGKFTSPELIYESENKSVILDFSAMNNFVEITKKCSLIEAMEHAIDVGDYIEQNIEELKNGIAKNS